MDKISLVVPFYNEQDVIANFSQQILKLLKSLSDYSVEVICIDDGSNDLTLTKLLDLGDQNPCFKIIEFSRNFGKEAALTAGIEAAQGDAVIPLDSDLQDPIHLIPQMLTLWKGGADVVLARRATRTADTKLKRWSAALFYRFHNMIAETKIPENVGDFRLLDRRVVDALKTIPENQRFMKGLFAWVGFRCQYVEYDRLPRVGGESKFSSWKLWEFALQGITSFSTVPLRIWSYVGFLGALLALSYACFIILRTVFYGVDTPGYASLFTAVIFMSSVQLISIGIIGEYIGRIYLEVKGRPSYLIRNIHAKNKLDVASIDVVE